ncbi:hypothetical protein JHK87_042684 [Glycine soja]|nr:hypothetical protein JHK87_042684 [Glycine soja]
MQLLHTCSLPVRDAFFGSLANSNNVMISVFPDFVVRPPPKVPQHHSNKRTPHKQVLFILSIPVTKTMTRGTLNSLSLEPLARHTNTRKVGRGVTYGLSVVKNERKSARNKMRVFIPPDKVVAVGPEIADFVIEISIVVQKLAPFNIDKWKQVLEATKE